MTDKILRQKDLQSIIGLSRSTIYRQVHAGTFPPPIKFTDRLIGWRASVILDWLANRPEV
ncbi:AlpA family phage regulatory protein [uncultured Roseovarius sp.]|uniref:helix-turn-helix transcriptional regulator n=1 Tax=Roseovarius sp. BRH_c41 TaxID=1629709 RepID=UPI000B0FB4A4|nr:AlpA family phage regulatory protein [uncultured Roseovarius sp.]